MNDVMKTMMGRSKKLRSTQSGATAVNDAAKRHAQRAKAISEESIMADRTLSDHQKTQKIQKVREQREQRTTRTNQRQADRLQKLQQKQEAREQRKKELRNMAAQRESMRSVYHSCEVVAV